MKKRFNYSRMELSAVVLSVIVSLFAMTILINLYTPAQVITEIDEIPVQNVSSMSGKTFVAQQLKAEIHTDTRQPSTWRNTISPREVKMLAQTIYNEAQVLVWNGDLNGTSYIGRQAAVAWCALNRLDSERFGATLEDVLSAPYQFAWDPDAEVTDHMMWLAEDVLDRWWAEKQGASDVGRTLPDNYYFFCGYDNENWFRQEYESCREWTWDLRDPYLT